MPLKLQVLEHLGQTLPQVVRCASGLRVADLMEVLQCTSTELQG